MGAVYLPFSFPSGSWIPKFPGHSFLAAKAAINYLIANGFFLSMSMVGTPNIHGKKSLTLSG